MTTVKVCDVRDYAAAEMCANAGVALIGLQARHLADRAKAEDLMNLADQSARFSALLKTVLVTQVESIDDVLAQTRLLHPDYVQLHSPAWTAELINALRAELGMLPVPRPSIIAFAKVPVPGVAVARLATASDAVLLDMTDYVSARPDELVDPASYALGAAAASGRPVLVAGGLTPENVGRYIEVVRPWGVDVQRAVEFPGPGGRKDPAKVAAFVEAVNRADRRLSTV